MFLLFNENDFNAPAKERSRTITENDKNGSTERENDFLKRENDLLRQQIEQLSSQVNREKENADHWRNQATMLLTHQPPIETAPAKKEDPEVALAEETNNIVIDEFADETLTLRLVRKLFW